MQPHLLRLIIMTALAMIGAVLVENITSAFHQAVHGTDILLIDHPAC